MFRTLDSKPQVLKILALLLSAIYWPLPPIWFLTRQFTHTTLMLLLFIDLQISFFAYLVEDAFWVLKGKVKELYKLLIVSKTFNFILNKYQSELEIRTRMIFAEWVLDIIAPCTVKLSCKKIKLELVNKYRFQLKNKQIASKILFLPFNSVCTIGYVLIQVEKLRYTVVCLSQCFTNSCPKVKYTNTQQSYS